MANIEAVKDTPVDVFPEATYVAEIDPSDPEGKRHKELYSDFISIPIGADSINLIAHRINLPDTPALVLKCRAELSLDGGVTWSPKPSGEKNWPWGIFPVAFTTGGGIFEDEFGNPISTCGCRVPVPGKSNPARMVRVTFIPLKPLTAKISVVLSEAGQ